MSESRAVRVLYMEDDQRQARVAKTRLEREGYLVDLAGDGAEGLAKYGEGSHDVLVVDRSMPVCDGFEVIRTLASRGPLPPVIMVTAIGSEQIAVEAMKLGVSDYLVKCVSEAHLDLLPALIERALDEHRLAQQEHKAEEALRESEGRLNAMLESIGEEVSMMDRELNVIWANSAARSRFGDDIVGKKCYRAYNRRERPCEPSPCSTLKAFEDGKVHEHDAKLTDRAGNTVCFHCTASVVQRDNQGDPTAVVAVCRDLTEHERNEEKLAAYRAAVEARETVNRRLQRDVAERKRVEEKLQKYAADLQTANHCLEEASLMALAASHAKSEFLSNVSHDIRTPLNAIIGFAEMILVSESLGTARRQAEVILKESEHLLELINDVLDDAKIESGKVELEHEPLDLRQMAQWVVGSVHVQAREKGLEISLLMEDDVPCYVLGDALRLRQVLLNLVGNAVKFTHRGGVTVRIEALRGDSDRVGLRFSVIDTGIGIPKEKHQIIFEDFSQVDGSTTRKYGGTGLGTSIARKLVHLMGGQIGLESEPGKGSTFWFTLSSKVCQGPAHPDESALISQGPPASTQQTKVRAGHILMAEDYPTNQQLARAHLESAGHRLEIVENGAEAVAACRARTFDLILMDLQMPEMDGYEAARLIRSGDSRCAGIPILAMTANASASARKACRKAGIDGVITKPIRRGPFLATIARWLASSDKRVQPRPLDDGSPDDENSTAMSDDPLDHDEAVEQFGGNRALLHTVTDRFLRDLETVIPRLREAIARQDAEVVRREAHKIRGAAASLTAMPLAAAAERLESLGETSELSRAGEALDVFEEEFQRLRRFVSGSDTDNHKSETLEKGAPDASPCS